MKTNLQDVCLLITDGKHGDCQNDEDSGYYFISCKDVKDGRLDYSGARQITVVDYHDTHRRTQLAPNDILITNSGSIGRMALVRDVPETGRTTFQKSVAIVKPNQDKAFPRWLYYCLLANKDALIGWAGGTAQ
ncbi:MAG: restriction endonuclease subunit S domain-containing protein [Thermoleophilia bacterium]